MIIPREIRELHDYGIARIFSPDDGRELGLQGMINLMLRECDFPTIPQSLPEEVEKLQTGDISAVSKLISIAEQKVLDPDLDAYGEIFSEIKQLARDVPVLGITGTGGAGKSSLTDELIRRFLHELPEKKAAILSVDPTKQKTGGALLGDRIRMNAIFSPRIYMRSLATRGSKNELSQAIKDAINVVKASGMDLVIVETSGIGQGDAEIREISDVSMYVMTSEFGAPTQLEKIDMIDFADLVVINKFEKKGSEDALNQVRKQYQRSHMLFDRDLDEMPVYGTIASQFNDPGTNALFAALMEKINEKAGTDWQTTFSTSEKVEKKDVIIPVSRQHYLREIADTVHRYHKAAEKQVRIARKLFQLEGVIAALKEEEANGEALEALQTLKEETAKQLTPESKEVLESWEKKKKYTPGKNM